MPFRPRATPTPLGRGRTHHIVVTKPAVERAASRMSLLLLGNDSWELFEGIPKHYSLRTRVRMKLRLSSSGFAWEICQTLFAVVASLLYVVQTYNPTLVTDKFDIAALVVFSVDYLLNLYCAESRFQYMISFMAIMDLVTILPALLDRITHSGPQDSASNNNVGSSFPFLRFIRVLRLLRLTRLIRAAGTRSTSAVQKQIHTIVLLITCIVFISAGVFHAVESANRSEKDPQITFGDALYFLLVTMATVGFGDIAPMTSIGKAVAVAVIVISFTIIPRELTRLNQLMSLQSQFRRFYHPSAGNPHILVVGHVTDERTLLDFFMEMYHPDRQLVHSADLDLTGTDPFTDPPCVVMGPQEPSEAMVNLLDHPLLQNRVTYIKGSVMSEEDLCRVGADAARACFVLTPKSCENALQTDAETVLRLLAIRNYNADLEIYTQMVSPHYSDYISEVDADHVLCINEIKLSLMAKSCLCPGLVTLVSNMFRSSSISNSTMQTYTGWQKEYVEGVAMEVYATKLPTAFYGLSFAQACDVLYQCFNGEVIMLGVFEPSSIESLERRHVATTATAAGGTGTSGATAAGGGESVHLPNLKVQALHPSLLGLPSGSRSNLRDSDPSSQMYINPGHSMRMGSGQIVYMLSESKRLTHSTSILQRLKLWLGAGNSMPLPIATLSRRDTMTDPTRVVDATQIAPKMHAPSRVRTQADVLLEEAVHPHTGHAIENHIIVVTDLDHVTMDTFVHLLRLRDHTREHADYHAILFLSWSKTKSVAAACRALQDYDNVFLMMAHQETSKTEFLRANILKAARCVLLSDKSLVVKLDGAAIDAQTIFHYLAILSIQSEYGVDTTSGLMPIVELTMPRTMKILDTALKKRTLRSYLHRQKIDSLLRKAANRHDPDRLNSKSRKGPWATTRLMQQLVQQGADNISSLENSIRLRKQLQERHSRIRQQDTSVNRSTTFDATGTALLPFFAAGYGFSDDVFDNMLCQSYFTPGLVRFIYALLFTKNGRPCRRAGSSHLRSLARDGPGSGAAVDSDIGLGIGSGDEDEENDDDDDNDFESPVVASSIVQIPVPISFVSKTFGELFVDLVQVEQVVAVALYRGSGVPFSLPYVACGPATDTILLKDDLVFVLAQPAAYERLSRAHGVTEATRDANVDKSIDATPTASEAHTSTPPVQEASHKPITRLSADPTWRDSIHQLVLNSNTQ